MDRSDRLEVMVADDDADVRTVMSRALSSKGYRVRAVKDGAEALELARLEHPDIAVLDCMMPGLLGSDVCEALKADAATRDIRVIMVSGRTSENDIRVAFDRGADEFVTKPFDVRELAHAVATVAEAAAA